MSENIQPTRIPLTSIPRQLAAFDGRRPDYPRVYRAIVNGDIPAEQVNGRWFISSTDLTEIARHFGMRVKAPELVVGEML